jgi:hypothetical protein
VVGFEQRLQQERQIPKQRLLRAQPPVVRDVDEGAILRERPDAAAVEVAGRDQRIRTCLWLMAKG